MAVRIPLVVVAGQIEQLQAGDQILVAQATAEVRSLTNHEGVTTAVIGNAVYIDAASGFKLAKANALGTASVIGLVYDSAGIAASAAGLIAVAGIITATTGQWDAVTGQVGGLTAGSKYYLDPSTAGKLTVTAPTTVGQVVQAVGTALNTTDMEINVALMNVLL